MLMTKNSVLRFQHYLIPLIILITCIFIRWQNVPVIDQLRLTVFDFYQQIAPRTYEDAGVRIVDIDERSLQEEGQWPWPRTKLSELLYRLRASGASVVGFDMVLPSQIAHRHHG